MQVAVTAIKEEVYAVALLDPLAQGAFVGLTLAHGRRGRAGRVLVNGYPTGVGVTWAIRNAIASLDHQYCQ